MKQLGGSAILGAIRKNNPEDYQRYGYAKGLEQSPGILKIDTIVESLASAKLIPTTL